MRAALVLFIMLAIVPWSGADTTDEPDTGYIIMELDSPRVFAFNTATIASPRGLSGQLQLFGIGSDGNRTLLCLTNVGWAASVDMLFYADAGTRALVAEGRTADGQEARFTVRLQSSYKETVDDEAATRLSALEFPSWQRGAGATTDSVAAYAMARLFVPKRTTAPLFMLALWSIIALSWPLWPRLKVAARHGWEVAVFAAAALSLALVIGMMAVPRTWIYSIGVPAVGGAASASVRHDATTTMSRAWNEVSWNAVGATHGESRFIVIDAASTAGLPLSALDRYRRIRFRTPPTIIIPDSGTAMLAPARLMAWGFDE
ncbi:MAG TPA: hypothetical protein VMX33_12470 [bacterium]|nr:hypothetical protein [bacterium]